MMSENKQIEKIKAKARESEKKAESITVKKPVFNIKTRSMEVKELVIKSGKEGNSFRRIGLIMSFIAAEILFFVAVYALFIQTFLWFIFIPYGIGIIFACRTAVGNKNADSKIAWILFLLIFAPIAFIVYLLAGELTASPLKSRKLKRIGENTKLLKKQNIPDALPARVKQDLTYIQNTSDYAVHYGGKAEYFCCGEDFFEDALEKLQKAERFIYMDFFILEEGQLANAIFEILIERVKAGVDVKIITDGLGSHGTLSLSKVRRIRKHGIKIVAFEPVLPIVNFFINYRNHRKIIVIDGKFGYVGGTNIADEYINAKERFGVWKDASMRIEGGAVSSLTLMFLRMWEYSSKEKPDYSLVDSVQPNLQEQEGAIVPYSDGPNEKQKLGKEIYANIIMSAQKTLYVMTPYLIVDSHITDLLAAKAKSGVDVRLIIPGSPDKKIVYALTRYNAERLIACGVRLYTYTPGFLHSKVMFSDNECAVVGSINMDFRSFYQQYESAAYVTKIDTLKQIEADFNNTFMESQEITLNNRTKRNIIQKITLAFLRLFAPLM